MTKFSQHMKAGYTMRLFPRISAIVAAAVVGSTVLAGTAGAADPTGVWLTQERDAHVRIAKCGQGYCGALVWLRDPLDPATGRPVLDDKNPDPARRSRPLLGTMIVIDFRPSADGTEKWRGRFYNADDGNFYDGSISVADPSRLAVQGCLLAFCETQTWTRVKR
jgi:uncharacterized protein (DUF2147 family)